MKDNPEIIKNRTEKRAARIRKVLEKRRQDLTVVMENINDPHNLSAGLRSCDAVGIYKVHLVYYGSQPFPKLGKYSSASAKKWVATQRHDSVAACYEKLRSEGKKIFTTHMNKEAKSLYEMNFCQPCAIVFGNEHAGVSDEAWQLADDNFLIPQIGMIQSLNISVATAVSLFEAFRQRLAADGYDKHDFDEEFFRNELNKWMLK